MFLNRDIDRERSAGTRRRLAAGSLTGLLFAGLSFHAQAETRSYVINWFTQTAASEDGDCAGGENPVMEVQFANDLRDLGKNEDEIKELMKAGLYDDGGPLQALLVNRGRIDGKPVNAYANPASVKDPHMHIVSGKYAYGFNLDGKGAASPNAFADPDTHEPGVNNQLFRALGCTHTFRGSWAHRPTWPQWVWTMMKDSMPAWLISVTGNDLSKDGDVTIGFDRAVDHATLYFDGEARPDVAYRIDPDPRSHNVFHGKIQGGVISITEPGELHMLENPLCYPEFILHQTHLRLTMKPDGNLDGIIGGYTPWLPIYWALGQGGFGPERTLGVEAPGTYYSLKQQADADPDPKTGQNRAISASYRIQAVPAFTAPLSDVKTSQANGGSVQTAQAP